MLLPGSAAYDRGLKFSQYPRLPSPPAGPVQVPCKLMPSDLDLRLPALTASTAAMLRERAEVLLQSPAEPRSVHDDELSRQTLHETIHELRVHQVELESQNEELRRTQAELASSQAMFFDFYDLAPVGYCTVSSEGLLLQANLTTAKLLGLPRRELLLQPITRFICAPDQDSYYLLTQQMAATGAPQVGELRLRKTDGTSFWARLQAVAVPNDNDGPLLRLVLTDITEFKQAQAVLLESRAELEATIKAIPDLLFEVDLAGRYLQFYSQRVDLLLLSPSDFLGKLVTQVMPAEAAAVALAALQEADGKGYSTGHQYALVLPQGERWFELSVARKARLHQQAPSFIVLARDITERKNAEAGMRIAAIAFECQEALAVMDVQQRFLRVNQAFIDMTGYSQQEALGQTPRLLRPEGRHPAAFYDGVWRDIHNTGAWQGEMWQRRKNGEVYPARVTTTVVTDPGGRVTHYVGSLTDTTASALQAHQREQGETDQRAALVREVHHRVKNSLQGITGLLHQSARQHPALAKPLQQVISQVQGIAVIHGLQGRADSALVRVCELTSAIADAVASLWQTPVVVHIPPAWQPCLVLEKEAVPLALVLNELIVNAVKHGGRAPVDIDLCKGELPLQVQISISNAGQFTPGDTPPEQAHGLKLVAALLPRQGARLVRAQQGERVITRLHLEAPTLGPDLKAPL